MSLNIVSALDVATKIGADVIGILVKSATAEDRRPNNNNSRN